MGPLVGLGRLPLRDVLGAPLVAIDTASGEIVGGHARGLHPLRLGDQLTRATCGPVSFSTAAFCNRHRRFAALRSTVGLSVLTLPLLWPRGPPKAGGHRCGGK